MKLRLMPDRSRCRPSSSGFARTVSAAILIALQGALPVALPLGCGGGSNGGKGGGGGGAGSAQRRNDGRQRRDGTWRRSRHARRAWVAEARWHERGRRAARLVPLAVAARRERAAPGAAQRARRAPAVPEAPAAGAAGTAASAGTVGQPRAARGTTGGAQGAGGSGGRGGSAGGGGSAGTGGAPGPLWDWVGVIGTGQSLAVGGHGNAPAMPIGATTQRFHNLKLSLGNASVPPFDPANTMLSMVPLVETIRPIATGYPSPYPRNIYGESFHTAMADELSTSRDGGAKPRLHHRAHRGRRGRSGNHRPAERRAGHRLDRPRLRGVAVRGRRDRAPRQGSGQELRRGRDRADARRIGHRQRDVRGGHGEAVAKLQPGPAAA